MSSRLNPTNFGYQNFYSGLLTSDITSGTLTLPLDTVPTPTSGILVIDPNSSTNREVILYTSKGASNVVCPSDGRGYSSTSAVAHLTGTQLIMAPVDKWFTALASGELSTDPLRTELFFDFVSSGCVWTGDSLGSTKNGSMTSGVVYIAGRRLTLVAITAHVFTASKDTYIDASDNGDGTALLTYTEVANNAASPALASNNLRLGIVVTGATTIAAAGSINQGQETSLLPIASSQPYAVTDSLGNLICNRNPDRQVLGYRIITGDVNSTTAGSYVDVAGLSMPIIVPTGRKIKLTVYAPNTFDGSTNSIFLACREGSTTIVEQPFGSIAANTDLLQIAETVITPSAGSHTYVASIKQSSAGTMHIAASASQIAYIKAELL